MNAPKKGGSFKCGKLRHLCCTEIRNDEKEFRFTHTDQVFKINQYMNCQTEYLIYLTQCKCGHQYMGQTSQKLQLHINKHRGNIKKITQTLSVQRLYTKTSR